MKVSCVWAIGLALLGGLSVPAELPRWMRHRRSTTPGRRSLILASLIAPPSSYGGSCGREAAKSTTARASATHTSGSRATGTHAAGVHAITARGR